MLEKWFNALYECPKRNTGPLYWKLCFIDPMGASFMVLGLALVGLVVNASDLVHRLQNDAAAAAGEPTCSEDIKYRPSPVSQDTERQLQLMTTLMYFENNFMLLAGVLLNSTALMVPWLAVQTLTVLLELLIFCSQVATVGLHMGRIELLTTATTIHNFLQVFCYLCKKHVIC